MGTRTVRCSIFGCVVAFCFASPCTAQGAGGQGGRRFWGAHRLLGPAGDEEHRVRRPVHVRPAQVQRCARRAASSSSTNTRDDAFRGNSGWANMVGMLQLVLPDLHPIDLDVSHPIFHTFFDVPTFDIVKQFYDQGPPVFRGIFEDNDPRKRLMVMINYNTDVSNFWEYSALGFMPMEESNEAYELGVNYLFYALTH